MCCYKGDTWLPRLKEEQERMGDSKSVRQQERWWRSAGHTSVRDQKVNEMVE